MERVRAIEKWFVGRWVSLNYPSNGTFVAIEHKDKSIRRLLLRCDAASFFLIAYGPPQRKSFQDALASVAVVALALRLSYDHPFLSPLSYRDFLDGETPFSILFEKDPVAARIASYAPGLESKTLNDHNLKFFVLLHERTRLDEEPINSSAFFFRSMPFERAIVSAPSMVVAYPRTLDVILKMTFAGAPSEIDECEGAFREAFAREWRSLQRKEKDHKEKRGMSL